MLLIHILILCHPIFALHSPQEPTSLGCPVTSTRCGDACLSFWPQEIEAGGCQFSGQAEVWSETLLGRAGHDDSPVCREIRHPWK